MTELVGSRPGHQPGLVPVPYRIEGDPSARLVATAIHAGHDVRPEVADLLALSESDRLREEDPFTDRLAACADLRALVSRSRFEVDLNRPRAESVYLTPEHAWGLHVWRSAPQPDLVAGSLEIYDSFYAELARHLDRLAATGPFVVFDIHSYNHRRDGADGPTAPRRDNPEVNIGTGSMPAKWRPVADALVTNMRTARVRGRTLDVRTNVRFRGANLPRWIHERYPATGCAVAVEFKKTFMDEWTGQVDVDHLDALTAALTRAVPAVLDAAQEAA